MGMFSTLSRSTLEDHSVFNNGDRGQKNSLKSRCGAIHPPDTGTDAKNTIRFFAQRFTTSCITMLYTEGNFKSEINKIYWMFYQLASELNGYYVTIMSFNEFKKRYKKWKKMKCNNPFLVVMNSDEETKYEMEKVSRTRLLHMTYWLLFMNHTSETKEFFENIQTPFNLRLVIAQMTNEDRIDFYEVYRVLNDMPLRVPNLGHWSKEDGYKIASKNLYERRGNLEGITLKTGFTDNFPMHYFVQYPNGTTHLEGFLIEVWTELERILNFSSLHFPSIDKVSGIPEDDGKWNGLVGMLQRQEIDVAVSVFVMDEQRSHVIDFTRPLMKTSYQIFYKNLGYKYHLDAILRPFKKNIWYTVVAWIFVSSGFSWICNVYSHKYGLEKNSKKEDFNLINSGLFFTKALCSQGHHCPPSSASSRMVFLTAYLVAGVLVPSYSAALIFFLTSRTPYRPFDSIRELVQIGTYKLQTLSKTAHYTYFSNSTNPLFHRVYLELMKKIPEDELPITVSEAMEKICKEPNLAHFGDTASAVAYVNKINLQGEKCRLMHLSKEISSIYSCMGLVRDSPYKMIFDYYLHRMVDMGIIDVMEKRIIPYKKLKRKVRAWAVIENKDVFQAYLILLLGMILSVTEFIIELIWARFKRIKSGKTGKMVHFHLNRKRYLSLQNKQLHLF